MGHIELAAPVVHIWYLRGTRSWLAYLLMGTEAREELKAKQLEKVIYFAAYLVTHVDEERRHADMPNLEAELASEIAEIERARDLDVETPPRRARGRARAAREGRAPRTSEIRARQRAVEKEVDGRPRARCAWRSRWPSAPSTSCATCFARKIIEDELLWRELQLRYGEYFEGGMGAETIADLISRIDLDEEEVKLRDAIDPEPGKRPLSVQRKQKAIKRLTHRLGLQPTRRQRTAGQRPAAR